MGCVRQHMLDCDPSLLCTEGMHWLLQVGFKATGRSCTQPGCRGRLKDVVLDWEDALPEDKLEETERIAGEADLAICLGTSLQITPACDLPDATTKAGGHRGASINVRCRQSWGCQRVTSCQVW